MTVLLRGRYESLEVIGEGGEGRVVRALDHQLDRHVALKIRVAPGGVAQEELLREARTLLSLEPHAGLPLVRDDFFEGGDYVIAMDWIDGTDLGRLLSNRGTPGLAPTTVLRQLAQVAEALTHLHTHDPPVVHGDVKPANLILARGGKVVLVDFGLAGSGTLRADRKGTLGYVAPEVAAGRSPTPASDVYSLAMTAFTLLTGSLPAGGRPEWPASLDAERVRVFERAIALGTATDPSRRPSSVGEFLEHLRGAWEADLPVGVLTFVMTDIVGSTGLWATRPGEMSTALVRHDVLLAQIVESRRGRLIKSMGEGDSSVSVFTSAGDAVAASADIVRAVETEPWPDGLALKVRAGVHTGEAEFRHGDHFGPTVNRTARIRGEAGGGQVFLSEVTAGLVSAQLAEGFELVDLGSHQLRGLTARERLFALATPFLSAPPSPDESPYRGLLAFEAEDEDLFFGREEVLARVIGLLAEGGFLALVGASGSGKSSLVRAGLISTARRGEIAGIAGASLIAPGPDPLGALRSIPEDASRLLVVDQFEEVFTLCDDPSVRAEFFDRVLDRQGKVVVSLRADFYGHCAEHEGLARLVSDDHVLLGAMRPDELRQAIEAPARAMQLKLESGLADLVLRDAAGEAGALPLLSHALMETWTRRDGRTLTIAGYHAAGGVRGAIANTAEAVYSRCSETEQRLAKQMFLRLTELGEGTEDSKRRVRFEELVPEANSDQGAELLLEKLTQSRLLTVDDGSVEVAHEALIREWPRLGSWLGEDREGLRLHRHLTQSANAWERAARDPGELYRGARLTAALEWCGEGADVSALEREFLDASRAEQGRELREARAQTRRARRMLAGVAVALVLALVAGSLAIVSRANARRSAVVAQSGRLAIQSREAAVNHPDLGLLLALEAARMRPSVETRGALLGALERGGRMAGQLQGVKASPGETVFSPDGKLLATVGQDAVRIWDVATHRALGPPLPSKEGGWQGGDFSPDGRTLAIAGKLGIVELWDVATRKLIHEYPTPGHIWLGKTRYVPNGKVIVTGGYEIHKIFFLDAASGRVIGKTLEGGPASFVFSPDSKLMAMNTDQGVQILSVATQRPVRAPLVVTDSSLNDMAFTPDGRAFFVADGAGSVSMWDPKTGKRLGARSVGDQGGATAVDVSRDGRLVAAGSDAGSIFVWDVKTGGLLGSPLKGDTTPVWDVRFSPDGGLLASAAAQSAVLWDLSGHLAIGEPIGRLGDASMDVAFRAGGRQLALGGYDGTVGVFDVATRREAGRVKVGPIVFAVAYSPDGKLLAAGSVDGKVHFWDATTLAPAGAPLDIGKTFVFQIAFSPDGKLLAVADDPNGPRDFFTPDREGTATLWDVASRSRFGKPMVPGKHSVVTVAFSPDGTLVATGGLEGRLELWNVTTQQPFGRPMDVTDDAASDVEFSPDGHRIASVGLSTVRIWDVTTQRLALPVLKGHNGFVLGDSYDPRGRFLATTSSGATRLWDPATGIGYGDDLEAAAVPGSLQTPIEILDGLVAVRNAFSPNGRFLATAGTDSRPMLWDLDIRTWRARACEIVGRNLTREEWRVYLPAGTPYRATCAQWPAL